MRRRKVVAPKVVAAGAAETAGTGEANDGVVAVSVHEEITRDYSIDPPSD